jgi:hypothetical protein
MQFQDKYTLDWVARLSVSIPAQFRNFVANIVAVIMILNCIVLSIIRYVDIIVKRTNHGQRIIVKLTLISPSFARC